MDSESGRQIQFQEKRPNRGKGGSEEGFLKEQTLANLFLHSALECKSLKIFSNLLICPSMLIISCRSNMCKWPFWFYNQVINNLFLFSCMFFWYWISIGWRPYQRWSGAPWMMCFQIFYKIQIFGSSLIYWQTYVSHFQSLPSHSFKINLQSLW